MGKHLTWLPRTHWGCQRRITVWHEVGEGHGAEPSTVLLLQHAQEREKLPWHRMIERPHLLHPPTDSTASPDPHRPLTLDGQGQLSRPKQMSLKGSQCNTQGLPLVSREITVIALQLDTHQIPTQVLIAVHLRDAQAERDDSTFVESNLNSRKFKPKSPTPETMKRIGKFYCLSRTGNTECLWRKPPRQELAKSKLLV